MSNDDVAQAQRAICHKYGAEFVASPPQMKIGIARNVRCGLLPIHGMRHPPSGDTTGWYIWAGDTLSEDPDFFVPLHIAHVAEWCPDAVRFLGLPPGWRFLVANEYEDVWEDSSLCEI